MVWRFTFPDIDGSSEKIADFSFICSYYTGATIPVPDAWLYPYLSTQYYSFQHYGAALMGRVLALPPGTAYNLALCVLVALCGTAFAGAVCLAARRTWVRALLVAGFVIGGTGMTGIVHLADKNVEPWTSMRFIGSAPMDKAPLGPWLHAYQDKFTRLDLPGEIFAYVAYLGDYHAPISGYYLMGLAVMSMLLWNQQPAAAVPGHRGLHAHVDAPFRHVGPAPHGDRDRRLAACELPGLAGGSSPPSRRAPRPSGSRPGCTCRRSPRPPRATAPRSGSCPGTCTRLCSWGSSSCCRPSR